MLPTAFGNDVMHMGGAKKMALAKYAEEINECRLEALENREYRLKEMNANAANVQKRKESKIYDQRVCVHH